MEIDIINGNNNNNNNNNNTNAIPQNQDQQSQQLAAQDAVRRRQEFLATALPEVIAQELLTELRAVLRAEYNVPLEAVSQVGYNQAIDGRNFRFFMSINGHSNTGEGNGNQGNQAPISITKPNMNINDYSILAHLMALLIPDSREWMLSFFRTDVSPEVRLQTILYLQLGIANGLTPIIDFLPWRITGIRMGLERSLSYWNNVNDKIINGDAPVRRIRLEYGGIVRGFETANQINGAQSGNKLFRDVIKKTKRQRGVGENINANGTVFSAYEVLYRAANQVLNLEDRVGSIREYQRIINDLYANITSNPATLANLMQFAQAANNRLQSLIGFQNSAVFGNAVKIRYLARVLFNNNRVRVTQPGDNLIAEEMRDVDQEADVDIATSDYLNVSSNNLQSILDLNTASLELLTTQRDELTQELQRLELLYPQEARNPEQTELIRRASDRLDQILGSILSLSQANEQIRLQLQTNTNLRARRIRRAEEEPTIDLEPNNLRILNLATTGLNNSNQRLNEADIANFTRVVRQKTFDENLS